MTSLFYVVILIYIIPYSKLLALKNVLYAFKLHICQTNNRTRETSTSKSSIDVLCCNHTLRTQDYYHLHLHAFIPR